MEILNRMLKAGEGEKPLCIICRKRHLENEIETDGVSVCKGCYEKLMKIKVDDYYETKGYLKRLFAPFTYGGRIRETLLDLKFKNCPKFSEPLGKLLYQCLSPYYVFDDFDLIVPIPLHQERFLERGFNQAELLADSFSKNINIPVSSDALFRIKNTKRQMNLSRTLRDLNMRGAFFAVKDEIENKKILLLDDIYTAGSTANEAAKELLLKGAREVSCLVVCSNFHKDSYALRVNRIPVAHKRKK